MATITEDVITSLNQAFLAFVRAYASTAGSEIVQEDDCTWFVTPITFPVYNGVVGPHFGSDAGSRVQAVHARFAGKGHPFSWVLLPGSTPADLDSLVEEMNPSFQVPLNGMEANIENIAPGPNLPSDAEIVVAEDEEAVI